MQNFDEPLTYSHFRAEGDIEFKTVLFIPTNSPPEFYEKYYDKGAQSSIKLYVRRVFISDDIPEIIPRYVQSACARYILKYYHGKLHLFSNLPKDHL